MHPGQSILLRYGKDEYQVVIVDDDQLAITTRQRLLQLNDEDIEQACRWIKRQEGAGMLS